jgi:hypothetical protein
MSVTLGIRLERLDAFTAALADVLPRAKAEDSCLHLEACRMVIDPTVFVLWEGWSDLVKYRDDEFLNTRTCSPSSWRRSRWRGAAGDQRCLFQVGRDRPELPTSSRVASSSGERRMRELRDPSRASPPVRQSEVADQLNGIVEG